MTDSIKDSLFSIRVKPRRGAEDEAPKGPVCEWEDCEKPGLHKAPKGAKSAGQFHNYCVEHVRAYNKTYNYFAGMNDDEIAAHAQKVNAPGSKETKAFGTNPTGPNAAAAAAAGKPTVSRTATGRHDPYNLFARLERNQARLSGEKVERKLRVLPKDKEALETLGLDGRPSKDEIKAAYKSLVKIHHPDLNGGQGSADRLRAIIAAHTHLKTRGFV